MPATCPGIPDRQNTPELLILGRATAAAHAKAQRLDAVRVGVSIAVASTALVAAAVPKLSPTVAILGSLWALAQGLVMAPWVQRETARAATVQEMFDVRLYEIPWNQVAAGDPLTAAEVSSLARRYRGRDDLITDYYEIPELPRPYDVLACEEQNLAWGARIRRRYAGTVAALLAGWSVLGVVIGATLQLKVGDVLLGWYVPALAALMMGADLYRRQQDTAATRSRVLGIVRHQIRLVVEQPDRPHDLFLLARQVQDVILATRRTQARVPHWFFLRFRAQDRTDFERAMAELKTHVTGLG